MPEQTCLVSRYFGSFLNNCKTNIQARECHSYGVNSLPVELQRNGTKLLDCFLTWMGPWEEKFV